MFYPTRFRIDLFKFLTGSTNYGSIVIEDYRPRTGGTLIQVIERVENEGFKVGLVVTVVDRQEGGADALAAAGYPLKSIFTREQLIG